MDKEKLDALIEILNQAEKKDRNPIIAKTAEANGLKFKEVMKLLGEAGYDPKADTPDSSGSSESKEEVKKTSVVLRHKTEFVHYRRAGLLLTQKAETYEVTEEQLAQLKRDYWVVIGNDKEDNEQK